MTVKTLKPSHGRSRYAQVAELLLEKISSGDYPISSLMPTESELCRQFGVSRTTVREAIRHISDLGLVSRKAGVGTMVRRRYANPRFVHAIESVSDIFQYTQRSAKPTIISTREIETGEHEVGLLQCPLGQRWIRLETLRTFAGTQEPMVLSEVFIPPAYGQIVKHVPTRSGPIYLLLESECGELVVEVQQEFRALQLDTRQARLLKVKPGSAGLNVIRHYFGDGDRLVLVALSIYPSDRFSYAMRLRYDRTKKETLE
jgi:GntR family transcriptional regulator